MSSPSILVVDDESDIRQLIEEILSDEGYDVRTAADAGEASLERDRFKPDLVLLDIWMPDTDGITLLREWAADGGLECAVVVMSGHGTVETAVEATRLGAVDYVEKPLSLAKLLRTVEGALQPVGRPGARSTASLLPELTAPVGRSPAIADARTRAEQLAKRDEPLLLRGESGAGREMFARFIHNSSASATAPFITVNAMEIDDDSAAGRIDQLFADARGGTLMISDLQHLPVAARKALLNAVRSLAEGDVRVMASVGTDEADLAREPLGQELLNAVGVLGLRVPSLREYSADVPELLRYYVDYLVEHNGYAFRRFSVAVQNRLRNYPWPGNVAELRNLVQRMLAADTDADIELDEVESELTPASTDDRLLVQQDLLALPLREAREQFERAYLTQQLELCGGKVGQLAKRVGMERTHLYRKLRALGVDFRQSGRGQS